MKQPMHIEISSELIEKFTDTFPTKIYKTNSTLFYEGQIPISGYLVVLGTVQISQKRKFKKLLQKGTLIGISELINRMPSRISAEVFPNTTVCFLDKSTVLEICAQLDDEFSKFLKTLVGQ